MKNVFDFLKKLKKNNHKEWFDLHRKEYEGAKKEFILFIDDFNSYTGKKLPEYLQLKGSDCVFRINRDIRFSNDKTPYKTNFGAILNPHGKKSPRAGFYLHIEPGNCFAGAGVYMPEKPVLEKIRSEIDYNGKQLEKLFKSKDFTSVFDGFIEEGKLSRVPKGIDPAHPYAEWLKLKSFFVMTKYPDSFFSEKDAAKKLSIDMLKAAPLIHFLNSAID